MMSDFAPFAARMVAEGLPRAAIEAFAYQYARLVAGETGMVPESTIEPVETLPDADTFGEDLRAVGEDALRAAVVIKLNGGLGTSMGLDRAKVLLPIEKGHTFLDLIARQAMAGGYPLILMNSFATQADTLEALAAYPELSRGLPQAFLQHKVPKVDRATLAPVQWPDEELTWCPPGHGDLYTALLTRGTMEALLAAGRRYAFISNSDNLGAVLEARILGFLVQNELPFLMEVADRTRADRKGGHLARRGNRLILRESAQCPADDRAFFQDVTRHRYFNTNNLWIDLKALSSRLSEARGILRLPLIRNAKTVDPRAPDSTPVYQLETAMGAAIELFDRAGAVRVPRARFAPVKTCADLLAVRSDAYELTEDFRIVLARGRTLGPPVIELDPEHYKLIDELDERFPKGPPSLISCRRLIIRGDVHFGREVVIEGEAELVNEGPSPLSVPDGIRISGRWPGPPGG